MSVSSTPLPQLRTATLFRQSRRSAYLPVLQIAKYFALIVSRNVCGPSAHPGILQGLIMLIEAWAYFTVMALSIKDIGFYTVMWLVHNSVLRSYKLMLIYKTDQLLLEH